MTRRRWVRQARLGLLLLGLSAVGTGAVGMVGAGAATTPGSGLGAIDVNATAAGLRSPFYSSGGEDVEAEAPYAETSMQTGGVTHALTSMFWPGDTGGHGGDTLSLLGAPCLPPNPNGAIPAPVPCVYQPSPPPQSVYDALNDPYKAEAQSGRGAPSVTAGGNGVSMTATAHPTDGLASTTMTGSSLPAIGDQFGRTQTLTTIKLVGPRTAVVDATSVIHDLSLAGGAVRIKAVTCVAHAVSDTVHASGDAKTTVTGMSIGGIPVTIDDGGLHIGPQSGPLPSTDQVNQALAQAGVKIFLAKPSKVLRGASVTLDSGSLVLMETRPEYTSQGNDTGKVLVIGGASIEASTGKGIDFGLPPVPPIAPPAGQSTAGTPGATGVAGSVGSPPAVAGSAPVVAGPQLAAAGLNLPGGTPAGWVVLTLAGAGLAAAGMRRLPDSVLAASGPSCTLEGGSP